jgi:hypothetical protein
MQTPNENQMVLELKPLHGGSYTQLSLRGPVCSAPQPSALRRLLKMFWLWNGYPVHVVLSVEGLRAPWLDVWCDALGTVPARHLEVRFELTDAPKPPEAR